LKEKHRLANPAIDSSAGTLYQPKPDSIEKKHHFKLEKTFAKLIEEGYITGSAEEEFQVFDSTIPSVLTAKIVIE
jgi:hypothetical protein